MLEDSGAVVVDVAVSWARTQTEAVAKVDRIEKRRISISKGCSVVSVKRVR